MLGPISNMLAAQAARKADIAARAKRARQEERTDGTRRGSDSFEASLPGIEPTESVRKLADADQEEAREDRQATQQHYGPPHPHGPQDGPEGSLDLRG
jgi:hypothetical protein